MVCILFECDFKFLGNNLLGIVEICIRRWYIFFIVVEELK